MKPVANERRGAEARVGTSLKNKWKLDALLGAGGLASVYAATHRNGNRVAVKLLHPELARDPDIRARFLSEGYAANAVGHRGVPQVLDDDADGDMVFLVMELLEGETLDERMRARRGPLPTADVLTIADGVLSVLVAAHAQQVVHRDLKPENIFLCKDGTTKVLDFGLARFHERNAARRSGTQLGQAMGTPGYMPPEQARGQWDRVDARSDLWAVGATMYTALSGKHVHADEAERVGLLAAAMGSAPSLAKAAPLLPHAIVEIVDRALAHNPDARWKTAADMRAAIAEALKAIGGSANTAPSAPQSTQRPVTSSGGTAGLRAPSNPGFSRGSVAMGKQPTVTQPTPSGSGRAPFPSAPHSSGSDNMMPVEIAPDTFWVGKRDPKSIFHANPYLRIFRGSGDGAQAQYNLLIDPGSSSDIAVVSAKVTAVLGGVGRLSGVFINHQDPDVGSSASVILGRYAPGASIFCSEATWRLIVHYNLPRERFVDTDRHPRGLELPTGHRVIPVPSPFCHFRGAVMLYDPETRVLFSGDLFGGLTAPGAEGLWADESDWSGMRAFHQAYMPTNTVVASAVRTVRRINPEIIAPQHGRLLRGPLIEKVLDRLERLPMGFDVMDDIGEGPDAMTAWSSVVNRVIHTAQMFLGEEAHHLVADDEDLRDSLTFSGRRAEVTSAGRWTVNTILSLLTQGQPPTVANAIKLEAILACEELALPSPDIDLDCYAAEGGPTVVMRG